jgi:hypothetical protein
MITNWETTLKSIKREFNKTFVHLHWINKRNQKMINEERKKLKQEQVEKRTKKREKFNQILKENV